jgi:hypothetical protein
LKPCAIKEALPFRSHWPLEKNKIFLHLQKKGIYCSQLFEDATKNENNE